MPFVRLSSEGVTVRRRRMLISGPPNHWKTTSLLTTPGPRAIVSSPGEKGYDTIPLSDPETIPFVWQQDKKQDSHQVVQEVTTACMECLAGKHGKLTSFCFDGAHKFFDYIIDSVTDGAWFAGDEFEPKQYGLAYRAYEDFFSRILHTAIPVVVVTSWSGPENDRVKRPGEKASDVPSHIWPDLPGKMAKRIIGEFSATVYTIRRKPDPVEQKRFGLGPEEIVMWQTRPAGEVLGCGLKGPVEVVKRIPTYIPASYSTLETLWVIAEKESANG